MCLIPCPFCGGFPEVERCGDNRQSCIVICRDCGCRVESNEVGAGRAWNMRYAEARVTAPVRALRYLFGAMSADDAHRYEGKLDECVTRAIYEAKRALEEIKEKKACTVLLKHVDDQGGLP